MARPHSARVSRRSSPRAIAFALAAALLMRVEAAGAPNGATPRPEAESPASGRFLVATEQVRGSFFQHSVVLLLSYAADGAIGVVVNRPTDVPLHDLVKGAASGAGELYVGGPVDRGSVLVLLRSGSPIERAIRVAGDLFLTVDPATLVDRAGSPDAAQHVRVYTGYAGWGPGQLDAEIARGDWIVASEGIETVFDDSPDDLWKKLFVRHHKLVATAPRALLSRRAGG